MPGRTCAVACCKSNQMVLKQQGFSVTFHYFPKGNDKVSSTLRKTWVYKCKRPSKFDINVATICSRHFTENDYERDMQNELLGLPLRRILKKNAVPSRYLSNKEQEKIEETPREKRAMKRKNKEIIDSLLRSPKKLKCSTVKKIKNFNEPSTSTQLFDDFPELADTEMPSLNNEPSETTVTRRTTKEIVDSLLGSPRKLKFLSVKNIKNVDDSSRSTQVFDEPSTSTQMFDDYPKLANPECTSTMPSLNNEPSETNIYKKKYEELLIDHKRLKTRSNKQINTLTNNLNFVKSKYFGQKKRNAKSQNAEKLLKKVLTKNQIAILAHHKKPIRWTREEIAVAFALCYYGKKSYLYLKNSLNYPLPALSTLSHWASQLNISQGILKNILLMMKLAGEDLNDLEKTVVLKFDEMKIKSIQEYDAGKDQVLGPYSQMQVVQAEGLFSNWKQPIFVAFDQKITRDILLNIITELHDISYDVVACVSHCGGGNIGLWSQLHIDYSEKPYFKHPSTNNNIYMFADAPHLLTLVRNGLLDTGFILDEGKVITKEPLQTLIKLTHIEVNPCWKISQRHMDRQICQRENVKMAAQLLSNSVSTGLIRYRLGSDGNAACDLGQFIGDISKWFDIFNSYAKDGSVSFKSAYGTKYLENQDAHIEKMISTISTMRPIGQSSLQVFQKGMIMSMKSLQFLFKDLKEKFNIEYICTNKLNQHGLVNFFDQIRIGGGLNEHPTPLAAIYRVREILLGNNACNVEAKTNIDEPVLQEYLSPNVLEKANIHIQRTNTLHSSSSVSSEESCDGFSGTSANKNLPEFSLDAMEYIAGYLAKKYREDFPDLGDLCYTYETDHTYSIPSWLQHIPSWVQQSSYDGLIKPSYHWLTKIKKWNMYFEKHHQSTIQKNPGVVRKLADKIQKNDDMPFHIIYTFCKLRTIIRIRFNNSQAENN